MISAGTREKGKVCCHTAFDVSPGKTVRQSNPGARSGARLGVVYLAQEPSVFRHLSVQDNIKLVLQQTGIPAAERGERL
ncbi:MAG: hypothetical protein AAF067_14525, partial [Pseudomonadota bacterium]